MTNYQPPAPGNPHQQSPQAHMPPPQAYAPPAVDQHQMQHPQDTSPAAPPKGDRPWFKKKRFMLPAGAVGGLLLLGAAGSGGSSSPDTLAGTATTQAPVVPTEESSTPVPTTEAPTTTQAPTTIAERDGSRDNPYLFGTTHSRNKGFLGAGWGVSIDEVRNTELDTFWADEDETGQCITVLGTATLEELDSDELTANGFSFPTPKMISNGREADSGFLECSTDDVETEGYVWYLDMNLIEGATAKWYAAFLVDNVEYDFVAIENMVYSSD